LNISRSIEGHLDEQEKVPALFDILTLVNWEQYLEICYKLGEILRDMSSPDTRNKNAMEDFVGELRTHNPFFKAISEDTATELLKRCEVLIFDNEFVYRKGDSTDTCLLILYGNVALHSTEAGVFKECAMGDTISEENILLENQVLR
jgi:hypothetical protein